MSEKIKKLLFPIGRHVLQVCKHVLGGMSVVGGREGEREAGGGDGGVLQLGRWLGRKRLSGLISKWSEVAMNSKHAVWLNY